MPDKVLRPETRDRLLLAMARVQLVYYDEDCDLALRDARKKMVQALAAAERELQPDGDDGHPADCGCNDCYVKTFRKNHDADL